MKRPLLIFTLYYLIGLILGRYLPINIIFVLFLFTIILNGYVFFLNTKWKGSFFIIIFFLLGYFLMNKKLLGKNIVLGNIFNKEIELQGIILDISEIENYKKITLKTENIIFENKKIDLKIKGKIYLEKENIINCGDKIFIKGKILDLEEKRNPGGYNEKIYLKSENVEFKSFPKLISKIEKYSRFYFYTNQFKIKLINVYNKSLPEKEAGIMVAMILGHTEDLSKDLNDLYKTSGIYHILSISGTHITTLTIFLLFIFKKFLSRKKSGIITILCLIFYCIFVGNSPSVFRSTIMGILIILGTLIYKETDLLTSLSFSTLIILIYNPLIFFTINFQLSYGAVFAIGIFTEPIERGLILLKKYKLFGKIFRNKKFTNFLSSFIGVNIIVVPITLYYFYYFHPYSLVGNLLILLTVNLVLILGFLVGIIGVIFLPAGIFLSGGLYYILKFYEAIIKILDKLPFANILIGRPKFIYFILYIIFILILLKLLFSREKKFIFYKNILKYFTILIFLVILIDILKIKKLEITMLDVGQGDSFIINTGKEIFLIDCGETDYVVNNYLEFLGKKKIDGIFLSHTDSDHSGGLLNLINKKEVENIFLPNKNYEEDELFLKLNEEVKNSNIKMHFLKTNDIINIGENLKINCFHPDSEIFLDNNNMSMVLKLTYKKISFLFTGDIEKLGEEILLQNNLDLQSDVLKISHHGSKTSTTENFLNKVNPKISIISVGKNNRYSHPSDEIINRLEDLNSKIFRTDENGAVIIKTNGEKIFIQNIIKN